MPLYKDNGTVSAQGVKQKETNHWPPSREREGGEEDLVADCLLSVYVCGEQKGRDKQWNLHIPPIQSLIALGPTSTTFLQVAGLNIYLTI